MSEPVASTSDASGPTAGGPTATDRQRIAALPFDQALAEFQAVVERLEAGNLPLEEAIAVFEQGALLQARCERLLGAAEARFQRLVESAGGGLRTLDLSLGEADEAG